MAWVKAALYTLPYCHKAGQGNSSGTISTLIYAIYKQAEHIFISFNFEKPEDKDEYIVLAKFDEYFIPKRNVIHERAHFHQRSQNSWESIETFLRLLYEQAEKCN